MNTLRPVKRGMIKRILGLVTVLRKTIEREICNYLSIFSQV